MRRKVIQPYSGHLAKSKNASYSVNRASGASSGVTAFSSTLSHKLLYEIRNFGVTEEELREEYAYVIKDLRWIFILAALMFTLLIMLNLVLR